ncbi:N-acyl homoserine lactonase [Xenorhabdus entomophaga]|uniref:N-acyl homoserine lactonase n=1 Tax=Xenorhabdus entomophaga TaxID=3136257 RepID=UPI0030F4AEB1
MNKIIIFIFSFLLGLQISFADVNSIQTQSGYDTAEKLTRRYNDTSINCSDESYSSFLCSGILLRGTHPSDKYHSWNPSPASQARGGVSFSYLRTDSKLFTLDANYTNGFIFYPYLTVYNYETPEVLCYFPTDANSDQREAKGCGIFLIERLSAPCQQIGVTTAQQWIKNFHRNYDTQAGQCGFDVSIKPGKNHANAFMQGLQARWQLELKKDNELILATWPQNIPDKLPIEAFFYLPGGLAGAQHDQRDFYQQTGKIVPIIKIVLPTDYKGDATFNYNPEDQIIKTESPDNKPE